MMKIQLTVDGVLNIDRLLIRRARLGIESRTGQCNRILIELVGDEPVEKTDQLLSSPRLFDMGMTLERKEILR